MNINITDKVAFLLNSCDKYSDIWPVFLDSLYRNFRIDNARVYINSESKDYADERFEIINVHPPKAMPFSDRLRYCVEHIAEEYLISMPEDCIVEKEVNPEYIEKAISILDEGDVASVCLVHIPGEKREIREEYAPFIERKYDYRYLISQQAAIWNTRKLERYIRRGMSPWEYEIFSSARGAIGNDRFFSTIDSEEEVTKYNYGYLVYRGYWCKEEIDRLRDQYGIVFDMQARECLPLEEIKQKDGRIDYRWIRTRVIKYLILLFKLIGVRL